MNQNPASMKSLYQFLMESKNNATYNDIVRIRKIYDRTWDENKPSHTPTDELYFILKATKTSHDKLCIRRKYQEEGMALLRKVFGVDTIDFNRYNDGVINPTKGSKKPIKVHITDKTIGPKVLTGDQENMMCDVFNNYFRTDGTLEQAIDAMAGTDKSRISWVKSSWAHCNDIRILTNNAYKDYYMVRLDNKKDPVVASYLTFREQYKQVCRFGRASSIDPTDVILYDEKAINTITTRFKDLCNMITNGNTDEALYAYRNFIKDTTHINMLPISLKKAVRRGDESPESSGNFVFYNTEEGKIEKPDIVSVKSIGAAPNRIHMDPKDITINKDDSIEFKGRKILLNNVTGVYAYVQCKESTLGYGVMTVKVSYRMFGNNILAMDITLDPDRNTTPFGKVSVYTWRRVLDHNEQDKTVLTNEQKKKFIELFMKFDTDKKAKEAIKDIVADGMKVGNKRFPYVLFK